MFIMYDCKSKVILDLYDLFWCKKTLYYVIIRHYRTKVFGYN